MVRTLRAEELENKLPIYKVEQDCIISQNADITVAYRVELPEVFTLSAREYETVHQTWVKAAKLLPKFSILHKQDWFIEEKYQPDINDDDLSFLSRSFERHFNERPFLNHYCYLFLTKTSPDRMKLHSTFSSLSRGKIIPKDMLEPHIINEFMSAVGQIERIIVDTGHIKLTRLTKDDIIGTEGKAGIIEKYLSVTQEDQTILEDFDLTDDLKIGNKYFNLFTFSDLDDMPPIVGTDSSYAPLSTDQSDFKIGFSSKIGLLLPCNHIYNQYIFIEDHQEKLKVFEKKARNMNSLSQYSRENAISKIQVEEYLNEAIEKNQISIRCHFNVFVWTDEKDRLKELRNMTSAAIASMDCKPRHNITDAAPLFWAGIPGNASDFPNEESFNSFIEQACCFFNNETNYKTSLSPFGIKMVDRMSGKPILVDISDEPMKKGYTTNRNKFILGPSGSGKSFFTNHMVRHYFEQGAHIVLIDTGNSYQGLCEMIKKKTGGSDGVYFTYTEENPIAFNPFYTDDGKFDIEKKESLKTLIFTLWKKENESPTKYEEVALSNAVNLYIHILKKGETKPCFNTFYEFAGGSYREILAKKNIKRKEFDIDNFINVLEPYYQGGEYDYLLNSDKDLDLLNKRFIVFELDNIKDNKNLLPVVTIIIMETYINKLRKLKGVRKVILIEEAWKAIAKEGMAEYIKYLFKTVRKLFGEAIVVTQEVADIINNPIVKETIINSSDCKILLDQRKELNKFEEIQKLLGLSNKERDQIMSINLNNDFNRNYKEVFISLGGVKSTVYATEVSAEEYFTYTTEETEKVALFNLSDEKGGDLEQAIKEMANNKRNGIN